MNSEQRINMEKKFMLHMSKKTIKGQGFSGFPSFLKNLILLPVIFSINMPLLILNMVWKGVLKMIKPRKPRVQKIYPKFENNYT